MFEKEVLRKIQESGQMGKLDQATCELDAECLYMGQLYEGASLIVQKDYVIYDLGCYMAAQAFLFTDYLQYIGIDSYTQGRSDGYIPPEPFRTDNMTFIAEDLLEYIRKIANLQGLVMNKTYAIMSAVPDKDDLLTYAAAKTFPNIAIWYPGTVPSFQGDFSDKMRELTDMMKAAECPYNKMYLGTHPEVKNTYEKKKTDLDIFIKEHYSRKAI